MKSNYKKLGGYIRQVDERNKDLRVKRLLGVSISKVFIDSIANLNGTEMNYYKIVKRNQFAYGPVTSRNGEKVSIACLNNEDECIISSSYAVFEIIDTTKLLPEYLMLWFKRPEFDRYARFHSHGSVREIFGWDELCNVELPIPSLQRQKEIVDAYETIESRIKLKRQINDNLEAQALAVFDNMFGTYLARLSDSSVGLPHGWRLGVAEDFYNISIGKTPPREQGEWFSTSDNDIEWASIADMGRSGMFLSPTNEKLTLAAVKQFNIKLIPADTVILSFKMTVGRVSITALDSTTNEAIAHFITSDDKRLPYTYCFLRRYNYGVLGSTSSIVTAINSKIIKQMPFILPSKTAIRDFYALTMSFILEHKHNIIEIRTLEKAKMAVVSSLILSR